jgi:type I restriction-modification system DNA methylase subunit
MITTENLKLLLEKLGFKDSSNSLYEVLERHYDEVGATISVDFANEKIIYPSNIQADRKTSQDFSKPEFFVVLECVSRLLEIGYKPTQIVLEPKTPGGRQDSNYYCDILVRNNDNVPYMLIECKNAGDDYDDEWKKVKRDGGQLFRYYNSYRQAQYLCLYCSDFVDGKLKRDYQLIKMTDNEEQVLEGDVQSYAKVSAENGSYEEFFQVWAETYEYDSMTRGAFEDEVPTFGISNKRLNAKEDLRPVDTEEIKKKYNEFAVILRQHNVGSHENAFDKLVNLFLAKVVDETNNPDDLHFYWKGKSYDDDFSLQDRLERLYRDGMYKFLHEDVTYIEDGEIDKAFRWVQNDLDATKRKIKEYFRQLKFFSDNDFSFISVHNERLFKQNAEILRKVVKMLQDIRLRVVKEDESHPDDSNQNQLLGDLFEGFLNKGVKQNEGQFFTPMPIVRFIVSALPLEKIIEESPTAPYAIDYACGAGHFLTEYNFRIAEFAKKYHANIPLSEYYAHTVGIEKEYRLSKVTKVSAFMYGHDDTNVIYADALTHIKEVKDGTFSVLAANPPYAVSGFLETLSEKERKSYSLYNKDINLDKNNAIETFFMERSAQLMKAGGVAGIVLPVSVLTKDGIYKHAREIILKNFDIISLTTFGKNTFGKTNTSTITLFLRRKETNTSEAEHYHNRVECWFGNWHEADEVYKDIELLDAYCAHMGYDMEDYKKFLNGCIPDRMKGTEVVQNYIDSFFGNQRDAMKGVCKEAKQIRKKYKDKANSPTFQRLSIDNRAKISNDAFYSFVKEIEKDKVYYFILAYNASCPVVIVNMPSGTSEGKKFLGYEWSDTKGNEGIKYLHVKKHKQSGEEDEEDGNAEDDDTMQQIRGINGIVTPLFNPANLSDEQKINSIIRKNFLGEEIEIPDGLEDYVTLGNLVEMLDFKSTAFKKELKTNVSLKVEVQSHFPIVKLKNYCEKINPSKEEIREVAKDTVVSFVEMASLGFGKIDVKEDKTIAELSGGGYTYFKENDVLIAKISPSMENGKCGMATGLTNGLGMGSTEFHVIRGKSKEQAKFILEYLNREYIRNIATSNETGASGHRRVPEYFYAQMPIPDVPQEILETIYKECQTIDEAQKVCEARMYEIMEEMEDLRNKVTGDSKRLKDIMSFATDRITYKDIAPESFISTDNMLQNCEGVRSYNGEPEVQSIIKYRKGDILLSNIRPYLKKLWLADRDGGCNPDVLVMRCNDDKIVDPSFVYYLLRSNNFFDYIMEDVKGLKMPRGKKEHIENYELRLPSLKEQQKLSKAFVDLDMELISLKEEIQTAPKQKQALLDKYLK